MFAPVQGQDCITLTTSTQALFYLEKGEIVFGPVEIVDGKFSSNSVIYFRKTEEAYDVIICEGDSTMTRYSADASEPTAAQSTKGVIDGLMTEVGIDFYVCPGAQIAEVELSWLGRITHAYKRLLRKIMGEKD